MNSQERVIQMFNQSGMSKKDWAKLVGMSHTNLISVCKGRYSVSGAMLQKIADACPEYNPDWVIRGIGAMLKDGTPAPSVANSVAANEVKAETKISSFESFLLSENEYLKQKIDQLIAIMSKQAQPLGKLNLQSEAGYAKEVMLYLPHASVA